MKSIQKSITKLMLLILVVATLSCGEAPSYTAVDNGIEVVLPSNQAVRVTFVADDIVKVEASADAEFDMSESLIDASDNQKVDFKLTESVQGIELESAALTVLVDATTGRVSYKDAAGNPIMSEDERSFSPITVEGKSGYTMSQTFDSPDDEALYGLGQHQADEINYKGKNEELFQYNTKVSIPFIVSTANYGLLWDNYSLTRFGDERPYSNIDQFKLYDKNGQEGGLTATYYDDKNSDHVFVEQVESTLDYENLETVENFPEGFPFANA